jgi:hypothetical protein
MCKKMKSMLLPAKPQITMKHLTIIAAITALIGTAGIRADGISVDKARTRCTVPHEMITASESQIEEMSVLRTLTLTPEQWLLLRRKMPGITKRLAALPHTYNDCTCGLSEEGGSCYAIWFPDGKVAIPLDQGGMLAPEKFPALAAKTPDLRFNVDHLGQFYFGGALIPYAIVKDSVAAAPKSEEFESPTASTDLQLYIELPAGTKRGDSAVAGRIEELVALARRSGREVIIGIY